MRNVVKPKCKHGCRFLEITPNLFLCPHADYGSASNLKGAVEEARRILERAGGYDVVLAKVEAAEEEQRIAAAERKQRAHAGHRVRYR